MKTANPAIMPFLSSQAMFSLVNPYIYGNQRGKSIQSSVTQFRVRNCDVTDQKRRRRRREVDAGVDNATDDTNATDIMVTQVGPRFTNVFPSQFKFDEHFVSLSPQLW